MKQFKITLVKDGKKTTRFLKDSCIKSAVKRVLSLEGAQLKNINKIETKTLKY